MGKVTLTAPERAVLEVFKQLSADDDEGAWSCFYVDVIRAAGGDLDVAHAICSSLRRRKLLDGNGRGKLEASYWISEKGEQAING